MTTHREFDPRLTVTENVTRALWELVACVAQISNRFEGPPADRRALAEEILRGYARTEPERVGTGLATWAWKQAGGVIEALDSLERAEAAAPLPVAGGKAERPASAPQGPASAVPGRAS